MEKRIKESFFKQVENEPYAVKLGMRLISLGFGHAVVEMQPQDDTSNIFGMTHGGAIFSLIDEAFQASCNSHGTVAVALNVTVTYHKSPDRGGTLRADSREIHRSSRTATYKIEVTDEKGGLIATCLALAYRKGEKIQFLEEG